MAGGGILTRQFISGILDLHWETQILCAPLFNATVYHSINCKLSGTLATGEAATSNGIPLGGGFIANRRFDLLWYAIPSTGNFSEAYSFHVLPCDEQSLRPASSWVLLAVRSHDTNTIKWMPGNVVFPTPEPNQEIKWGSIFPTIWKRCSKDNHKLT